MRLPISISFWQCHSQRFGLKVMALLIAFSFIFPYLTWAFEPQSYTIQKTGQISIHHLGKTLSLPEKLGTIHKGYQGDKQLIVHIQDLHCHYEVQKNIANIIHHLAQEYELRLVGEEGAFACVNTTKLRTFPMQEVKVQVADYFVRQGKLTGAEFYAGTGEHPVNLCGIETPDLYLRSEKAVRSFLNQETLGYCYDIREQLEELKSELYSPALKRFDQKRTLYRQSKMELLAYCAFLKKTGTRLKVPFSAYPALKRFLQIQSPVFTRKIDSDQLFQEADDLDASIRRRLYTTEVERELDDMLYRLDIMEKLLNISVTTAELREFRSLRSAFYIRQFVAFIERNVPDNEYLLDHGVYQLDNHLKTVEDFYQMAEERSVHFVDNLQRKMERENQKIAVMISGGFHTREVLAEIERQGISYVSIKPRFIRQDLVNPYFQLLQNRYTPLEKLLVKNQNILALRTSCSDGNFSPEQIVRSAQLTEPHQIFFNDSTELLLENVAVLTLKTQGLTNEQVVPELIAVLESYAANEPDIGVQLAPAFVAENAELLPEIGKDLAVVIIPTSATDSRGTQIKTVAVWDKHLNVPMDLAGIIPQIDIAGNRFLFYPAERVPEVVADLVKRQSARFNPGRVARRMLKDWQQYAQALGLLAVKAARFWASHWRVLRGRMAAYFQPVPQPVRAGLIGKYIVLSEPEYDAKRGVVFFKGYHIKKKEVKNIEIKAHLVYEDVEEFLAAKLSVFAEWEQKQEKLSGRKAHKILPKVQEWIKDRAAIDRLLLLDSNNPYGIQGLGTKNMIAVGTKLQHEPMAWLHETLEAMGMAGDITAEEVLSFVEDHTWFDKKMKDPNRLGMKLHYAIIALQHELNTAYNYDLYFNIKGRLSRREIFQQIRETGVSEKAVIQDFYQQRSTVETIEQERELLAAVIKAQKEAEAQIDRQKQRARETLELAWDFVSNDKKPSSHETRESMVQMVFNALDVLDPQVAADVLSAEMLDNLFASPGKSGWSQAILKNGVLQRSPKVSERVLVNGFQKLFVDRTGSLQQRRALWRNLQTIMDHRDTLSSSTLKALKHLLRDGLQDIFASEASKPVDFFERETIMDAYHSLLLRDNNTILSLGLVGTLIGNHETTDASLAVLDILQEYCEAISPDRANIIVGKPRWFTNLLLKMYAAADSPEKKCLILRRIRKFYPLMSSPEIETILFDYFVPHLQLAAAEVPRLAPKAEALRDEIDESMEQIEALVLLLRTLAKFSQDDAVLQYLVKMARSNIWHSHVTSEVASVLARFLEDEHPEVIRLFTDHLTPGWRTIEKKRLDDMLAKDVTDEKILRWLRTKRGKTRAGFMVLLRHRKRAGLLQAIVLNQFNRRTLTFPLLLRLYAIVLHASENITKKDKNTKKEFIEMWSSLEMEAGVSLRATIVEMLKDDAAARDMVDNIWLQDEVLKIYVATDMLDTVVEYPRLKNSDDGLRHQVASSDYARMAPYFRNARTSFKIGGRLIKAAPEPALFLLQVIKHELGHVLGDAYIGYHGKNRDSIDPSLQEHFADLFPDEFSRRFEQDVTYFRKRFHYEEHFKTVAEHDNRADDEYMGGRAVTQIIEKAFEESNIPITSGDLIEAELYVFANLPPNLSVRRFVHLVVDRYTKAYHDELAEDKGVRSLLKKAKAADIENPLKTFSKKGIKLPTVEELVARIKEASLGGIMSWLKAPIVRILKIQPQTYDLGVAWLAENSLSLTIGGVVSVVAGVAIGLDVSQMLNLGYVLAWPIFFGLHYIKANGERAPPANRILAGMIAIFNLALMFTSLPLPIMFAASFIIHWYVNQVMSRTEISFKQYLRGVFMRPWQEFTIENFFSPGKWLRAHKNKKPDGKTDYFELIPRLIGIVNMYTSIFTVPMLAVYAIPGLGAALGAMGWAAVLVPITSAVPAFLGMHGVYNVFVPWAQLSLEQQPDEPDAEARNLEGEINRFKRLPEFKRLNGVVGFSGMGVNLGPEFSAARHNLLAGRVVRKVAKFYGWEASRPEFLCLVKDFVVLPFNQYAKAGRIGKLLKEAEYQERELVVGKLEQVGFKLTPELKKDLLNFSAKTRANLSAAGKRALACESVVQVVEATIRGIKKGRFTWADIPDMLPQKQCFAAVTTAEGKKTNTDDIVANIAASMLCESGTTPDQLLTRALEINEAWRKEFLDAYFKVDRDPKKILSVQNILLGLYRAYVAEYEVSVEEGNPKAAAAFAAEKLSRFNETDVMQASAYVARGVKPKAIQLTREQQRILVRVICTNMTRSNEAELLEGRPVTANLIGCAGVVAVGPVEQGVGHVGYLSYAPDHISIANLRKILEPIKSVVGQDEVLVISSTGRTSRQNIKYLENFIRERFEVELTRPVYVLRSQEWFGAHVSDMYIVTNVLALPDGGVYILYTSQDTKKYYGMAEYQGQGRWYFWDTKCFDMVEKLAVRVEALEEQQLTGIPDGNEISLNLAELISEQDIIQVQPADDKVKTPVFKDGMIQVPALNRALAQISEKINQAGLGAEVLISLGGSIRVMSHAQTQIPLSKFHDFDIEVNLSRAVDQEKLAAALRIAGNRVLTEYGLSFSELYVNTKPGTPMTVRGKIQDSKTKHTYSIDFLNKVLDGPITEERMMEWYRNFLSSQYEKTGSIAWHKLEAFDPLSDPRKFIVRYLAYEWLFGKEALYAGYVQQFLNTEEKAYPALVREIIGKKRVTVLTKAVTRHLDRLGQTPDQKIQSTSPIGGIWPWLKAWIDPFLVRLGLAPGTYDRWVAWLAENGISLLAGSIASMALISVGAVSPELFWQAGYLAAWPIFFLLH
ncbi:hypothetical protein KAR34_11735, partial [bacterium]|nr:hypothetical protein [bacterium]